MKRPMVPYRPDDLPVVCLDCGGRLRWVAERFAWVHRVRPETDHAPRLSGVRREVAG